jgi:hypothetical protein
VASAASTILDRRRRNPYTARSDAARSGQKTIHRSEWSTRCYGGDVDVEAAGRRATIPVEYSQCGHRTIDGERWNR